MDTVIHEEMINNTIIPDMTEKGTITPEKEENTEDPEDAAFTSEG